MTDFRFGSIMVDNAGSKFSARCDAIAVDGDAYSRVMIVSAIGPATTVKSIAASLSGSRGVSITAMNFGRPITQDYGHRSQTFVSDSDWGYTSWKHRLGFDLWHMLAVSKNPSLIPANSGESIVQRLMSNQFTTPLLRGWKNYLVRRLKEEELLKPLNCFQCKSGLLLATSEQLDTIVSDGLSRGHILIEEDSARAS